MPSAALADTLFERIRSRMADDRFATATTGARFVSLDDDGLCVCELQFDGRHRNAIGAVMGGTLFTLADFAFAIAANAECLKLDRPLEWVSTSSDIHFLSQPQGESIIARCAPVRCGKSTCLFQTRISDSQGHLVAVATVAGHRMRAGVSAPNQNAVLLGNTKTI